MGLWKVKKLNCFSPLHFSLLFKTVWWVQCGEWPEYKISHHTYRQTSPGLGIRLALSVYALYRKSVWRKDQYPNSTAFNMHLLTWFLSVLKPKGVESVCIRQWHCWLISCGTEQWLLSFIRKQRRNIFVKQWNERHPNGSELVTWSTEPARRSPIDSVCWSLENNLGNVVKSAKGGVSF